MRYRKSRLTEEERLLLRDHFKRGSQERFSFATAEQAAGKALFFLRSFGEVHEWFSCGCGSWHIRTPRADVPPPPPPTPSLASQGKEKARTQRANQVARWEDDGGAMLAAKEYAR